MLDQLPGDWACTEQLQAHFDRQYLERNHIRLWAYVTQRPFQIELEAVCELIAADLRLTWKFQMNGVLHSDPALRAMIQEAAQRIHERLLDMDIPDRREGANADAADV